METTSRPVWTSAAPQQIERIDDFETVQNALEEKLNHRPERQHLIDAHILPSISGVDIAPSIAASIAAISFQRIGDRINTKLRRRPTREDLINNGVIRVKDPNVAASLQGTQTHLEFQRHAISINQKLHRRPSRSQLAEDHIIVHDKEFDVDPKVTDAIISLRRARTVSALEETIATKHSRGPIHPLHYVDLQSSAVDSDAMVEDGDFSAPAHFESEEAIFCEGDWDDDDEEDGEYEYYSEEDSAYDDVETQSSTSDVSVWGPTGLESRHSSVSFGSFSSSASLNLRRLSETSIGTNDGSC